MDGPTNAGGRRQGLWRRWIRKSTIEKNRIIPISSSIAVPISAAASTAIPLANAESLGLGPLAPSPEEGNDLNTIRDGNLWMRAYEQLREKEGNLVKNYEEILSNTIGATSELLPQDKMKAVINAKFKVIEERKWEVKLGKNSVAIVPQVERLIKLLQALKDIGSTVAGLDPIHAGIPWAGICILLPLFLNHSEQEAKVIDCLEEISNLIIFYTTLEKVSIYTNSILLHTELPHAVTKVYYEILHFQTLAASHLDHNTFRRIVHNIKKVNDWSGLMDHIRAKDRSCRDLMQALDKHCWAMVLEQNSRMLSQISTIQNQVDELHSAYAKYNIDHLEESFSKVHFALGAWINTPLFEGDLQNKLQPQKINENSSKWILHHHLVQDWIRGETWGLWIHGRPGCGKTVIAAIIIDYLKTQFGSMDQVETRSDTYVGYVFCSESNSSKNNTLGAMKILVWQLIARHTRLSAQQKKHIISEWHAMSDPSHVREGSSSNSEMQDILLQLMWLVLQSYGQAYLIVDGLDECSEPKKVVQALQGICASTSSACVIRILFVSQRLPELANSIGKAFSKIDLDSEEFKQKSTEDIDIVTTTILRGSADPRKTLPKHFIEPKNTIMKKSNGMILWATLVAHYIKKQSLNPLTEQQILRAVDEFPEQIEPFFEYLLKRCFPIPEVDNLRFNFVISIFQWVLLGVRPIRLCELCVAISLASRNENSPEGELHNQGQLNLLRSRVEDLCYPLLTIQQDDTIHVVHSTLKDFIKHSKSTSISHIISKLNQKVYSAVMATTCLEYLNLPEFANVEMRLEEMHFGMETFKNEFVFFDFASNNWIYYWRQNNRFDASLDEVKKSFHRLIKEGQGLTWLQYYSQSTPMRSSTGFSNLQAEINHLLNHSKPQEWLVSLLERLLAENKNIYGSSSPHTVRLSRSLAFLYQEAGRSNLAEYLYQVVLEHMAPQEEDSIIKNTRVSLALVYADQGRLKQAEKMMKEVVNDQKTQFGDMASSTLTSMNNLASVYFKQGRYRDAQTLFLQVYEKEVKQFGNSNRNTLVVLNNLSCSYTYLGQFGKALELSQLQLSICKNEYDDFNPTTLLCKHNIAHLYRQLGNHKKAEELELQVIQIRSAILGDSHHDTLKTIGNLASTYKQQSRFVEAEALFRQCLEKSLRYMGPSHPTTLYFQQKLASILQDQSHYREAKPLLESVTKAQVDLLGNYHHDVLTTNGLLVESYLAEGEWGKAEQNQAKIFISFRRLHGLEHRSTNEALLNLGIVTGWCGKYRGAMEISKRVYDRRSSTPHLGTHHPSTILSLAMLGVFKEKAGKWKEAGNIYREANDLFLVCWGSKHQNSLQCKRYLAGFMRTQGQLLEAENLLQDVLVLTRKYSSRSYGEIENVLFELSQVYYDQGNFDKAAEIQRRVLDKRIASFGEEHYSVGIAKMQYSRTCYKQSCENMSGSAPDVEGLQLAQDLYESALKIIQQSYGKDHPVTWCALNDIALILKDTLQLERSEILLSRVANVRVECLGLHHPDTLSSLHHLATLYHLQNRLNEAIEMERIVLKSRRLELGTDHPHTLESETSLDVMLASDNLRRQSIKTKGDSNSLVDAVISASKLDYEIWNLERTIEQISSILGEDDWETINTRRGLAIHHMKHGNYQKALYPLQRAWNDRHKVLGPTDSLTCVIFLELARCCKKMGILSNRLNSEWKQAVLWAVQSQDLTLLDFLILERANVNVEDSQGQTPLFYTAKEGMAKFTRRLLSAGANVEFPEGIVTPLHVAAKNKHAHVLEALLSHKSNLNVNLMSPEGFTPLCLAVREKHFQSVRSILARNPDVDLVGHSAVPPLATAIIKLDFQIVKALVEAGASLELTNENITPVHTAVIFSTEEILRYLLERGAKTGCTNQAATTPLHEAAIRGLRNKAKLLLDYHANIEARDVFGDTPLASAAFYGHDLLVDDLLLRHADINSKSFQGLTALHRAAYNGHLKVVQRILNGKNTEVVADIEARNVKGDTPLTTAAVSGHDLIVDYLLLNNANVNSRSLSGATALHMAASSGHLKVVQRILKERNIEVNGFTSRCFTPLYQAVAYKNRDVNILNSLLAGGADPNIKCGDHTLLQAAIIAEDMKMITRLLEVVDINIQGVKSYTSLHYAALKKNAVIATLLLDHGAKLDASDLGYTALHLSSSLGDLPLVQIFLEHQQSALNAQTENGLTLLHYAAWEGRAPVVQMLLDRGADANIVGYLGSTALSLAVQKLENDCIAILLPHTKDPFLLDALGKNSLDWASAEAATFASMGSLVDFYQPTEPHIRMKTVRRYILQLSDQLLCRQISGITCIPYGELGRCLLALHDKAEASIAYQLYGNYSGSSDAHIAYSIPCDNCNIDIVEGIFTCQICVDVDLCSKCIEGYNEGTILLKGCVKHEYFRLPSERYWRAKSATDSSLVNHRDQTVHEWLKTVKQKYESFTE